MLVTDNMVENSSFRGSYTVTVTEDIAITDSEDGAGRHNGTCLQGIKMLISYAV